LTIYNVGGKTFGFPLNLVFHLFFLKEKQSDSDLYLPWQIYMQ